MMNDTTQEPETGHWRWWHTLALLALLIAIGAIGWLLPRRADEVDVGDARVLAWLLIVVFLLAFALVAGQGVTGVWRGLLIDQRNTMSLSRLQLLLWTVIVLAGFLTAALANTAREIDAPLDIALPSELLWVLGISVTSLIGSPLILSLKEVTPPDPEQRDETLRVRARQEGKAGERRFTNDGLLIAKRAPKDAGWADLFKGEETGNGDHLDLSRVQLFFFTAILVFAYAVALGEELASADLAFAAFPVFEEGMVLLLGISHAGYLGGKAVPRSRTEATGGQGGPGTAAARVGRTWI